MPESFTFRPAPLSEADLALAGAALQHIEGMIARGELECAGYVLVGGRLYREDGEAEPLPLHEFLREVAAVLEERQVYRRERVRESDPDPRDAPAGAGCLVWTYSESGGWDAGEDVLAEPLARKVAGRMERQGCPAVVRAVANPQPESRPVCFWDFDAKRRLLGAPGDGFAV
jgi:hypothetical protein